MTEIEAYDHAQVTFGKDAGVWRASPNRHVVGRWVPLAESVEPRVGAFALPVLTILKTKQQALLVLGEGKDWSAAFMAAEHWRKAVVR